jgi:hypothetical protein
VISTHLGARVVAAKRGADVRPDFDWAARRATRSRTRTAKTSGRSSIPARKSGDPVWRRWVAIQAGFSIASAIFDPRCQRRKPAGRSRAGRSRGCCNT